MFGISGTELFLIVVFVLLIFGPDKLPEFARTIGKFMNEFKRAQASMETMLKAEMYGAGPEKPAKPAAPVIDEDDDDEDEEEDEE